MPATLTGADINIPGAWNPIIFSPEWLAAKVFLGATPPPAASMQVSSIGPVLLFEHGAVRLQISPVALLVTAMVADSGGVQAMESAARAVLEALHETPVRAFGINLTLAVADWEPFVPPDLFRTAGQLRSSATQWSYDAGAKTVNISLRHDVHARVVSINHHRAVSGPSEAAELLHGVVVQDIEDARRILVAAGAPMEGLAP
jgi:hypothetical protein